MTSPPLEWKADQKVAGRYRVRCGLGRGAGGGVLAVSPAGKTVVVKPLAPSMVERPEAMFRLRDAVLKLSALSSPGLVRVVEVGVDDITGRAFVASELVEGPSLLELVSKRGPLDPREAMAVMAGAAAAISSAHEAGVVHGDLKPEHLIIGRDESVRVIDFALERATPVRANPKLARNNLVLGTPQFVAPEVARGEVADAKSDLYSLGATIFEALVGQPPWTGDLDQVVVSRVTGMPPSPAAKAPGLDRRIDSLILRALAPDARSRWGSMSELSRNASLLAMGQSLPDVTGIELEMPGRVPSRVSRPLTKVPTFAEAAKTWRGPNLPVDPQGVLVSDEELKGVAAPASEGSEEVQELDWLKMSLSPEQMRAMSGKFAAGELPAAPPPREPVPVRRVEAPLPVLAPSPAPVRAPVPVLSAPAASPAARSATPPPEAPITLAPYKAQASDDEAGGNRLYWIVGAVLVVAILLAVLLLR